MKNWIWPFILRRIKQQISTLTHLLVAILKKPKNQELWYKFPPPRPCCYNNTTGHLKVFFRNLLMLLIVATVGSSTVLATGLGNAVISNVEAVSGGCVQSTTNVGGPQFWDIAQGGTYTITLSGLTDCAHGGNDATVEVIVKSSSSGNTCLTATKVSTGVYTFDFTAPANACATMPILYCTNSCSPNSGMFARHDNPAKPLQMGHLRAANFDGACSKTSDDNDCSNSCVPFSLTVTASGATTFCAGGSVTLTACCADTYLWSNGETTESITVNASGIYTVFGQMNDGCPSSNYPSQEVVVNPLPSISLSTDNGTCSNGNLGSITASSTDNISGYSWSNGETGSTVSNLAAGTYSVTATDNNGCTVSGSSEVTRVACCPFTDGGQIGNDEAHCGPYTPSTIESITPPTGGLGDIDYVWLYNYVNVPNNGNSGWVAIAGSNSETYSPGAITQTTYYLRCARRNGCTIYNGESNIVAKVVNDIPVITCTPDNGTCTNGNLGTASVSSSADGSYLWSNGATSSSISNLVAGTYAVTVTDNNGCSASCSSDITTVACCPLNDGGQIGSDESNCGPYTPSTINSITQPTGGLGNIEYVWLYNYVNVPNNGSSGWVVIPGANGSTYSPGAITQTTYYLRCARRSGCDVYNGESNIVAKVVNPIPSVSVSINGTTTMCQGLSRTLTASGAASYVWNTGATTASINVTASGTYTVTGTNVEGCPNSSSITITVLPAPSCSLSAPSLLPVCGAGRNRLCASTSGGNLYSWSLLSSDNSWSITRGGDSACVTYKAGNSGTSGTFVLTTTNSSTGCSTTCNISFGSSCEEHCSRTQGYYGSTGKVCDGRTNQQVVAALLSTPLTVGYGSRTLTILTSEASCLIAKMPGSSSPDVLPNGTNTCATFPNNQLQNGKFKNVLLGQTLALGLNMRMDPSLGAVTISGNYLTTYTATSCVSGQAVAGTERYFTVPQTVITALAGNNTISGLLNLANKALGSSLPNGCPASLSDINAAVDAVNRGFDECRVSGGFNALPRETESIDEPTIQEGMVNVNVYPNPFGNQLEIQVESASEELLFVRMFNITGQLVNQLNNVEANKNISLSGSTLTQGVYFIEVTQGDFRKVMKVIKD